MLLMLVFCRVVLELLKVTVKFVW